MTIKRNWFIYLSLILYMASALLILIFGINQLREMNQYTYLVPVVLIAGFFAFYVLLNLVFSLLTRPLLLELFSHLKWLRIILEILIVLVILIVGIAIRLYFIKTYRVEMESDFKFYYDVAVMIKNHTLNTLTDNEYITLFPNTYGYSYILSIAMRIFGTSKNTCLYLNVAFSLLTALFCYGIGKKIAGSAAGLSALLLVSFWPSQIIFSNINGTEAAFNFFLYGAAFFAVILFKIKTDSKIGTFLLVIMHFLCGVLIALSSAIRPMGLILFIACILCFLSINEKLKFKDIYELSIRTIFLSKGIIRVILIVFGYFVCSQTITAGISQSIENNVAGSGAMGYSLMVGMNIESDGGYNEDMMNFLYNNYRKTQSAAVANDECLKIAIMEIKSNPLGIAGLLAKKFYLVWSNDDYATTTNIVTMNNQGLLTKSRQKLFYLLADINNIYYLFAIFLSAIGSLYLMKKDNIASLFVVFFVGTVFLLIILEMQNRYHYYSLQSVAILAAGGIGFTYDWYKKRSLERICLRTAPTSQELSAALESGNDKDISQTDLEAAQEKPGSSLQTIDVMQAIADGHIIITAAKSYADELNQTIATDQSEEQNSCDGAFFDCTEELWEEYNQNIRQKQIQIDNSQFEQKKDHFQIDRKDEKHTADTGKDNIILTELLHGMEENLLKMKAIIEERDKQSIDNKAYPDTKHTTNQRCRTETKQIDRSTVNRTKTDRGIVTPKDYVGHTVKNLISARNKLTNNNKKRNIHTKR